MVALGILTPTANILFLGTAETSAGMLVWWTLGALTLHGIGSWFLADLTDE
jgi:hypothetical protein